jgi:hypothetical protein
MQLLKKNIFIQLQNPINQVIKLNYLLRQIMNTVTEHFQTKALIFELLKIAIQKT